MTTDNINAHMPGCTAAAGHQPETVAILIPSLKKGGAEKQAALLARVLGARHRVLMILTDATEGLEPENLTLCGLDAEHIIKLTGRLWSQYRSLCRILASQHVTLLYCYLTRPDFIGPFAARRAGVRRCYQGLRNSALPWWKLMLERIGSLRATGAVANSHAGGEYFAGKGIRDIIVIPNCYLSPRPARRRTPGDTVTVVTVARFVEQKDYPTAIAVMARAMSADPALRYLIIGHGELERNVREMVRSAGIADRTDIMINPPGVPSLIDRADIYLSTSLFEGTSNSIMEAMDVSLPVVATDVGDNARLVEHGHSGYICPTGDVTALADAVTRLAADPGLRNDMGCLGNERLHRLYSYDAFARRYLDLTAGIMPDSPQSRSAHQTDQQPLT